jgi:hypothetical protein
VMEWGTVNTPDWDDMVIFPGADIIDYDIGGDGDIIYAILEVGCDRDPTFDNDCDGNSNSLGDYALVKSDDGGVTWTDITANVFGAASIPDCADQAFDTLWFVSVAPDDEDWVAVVGRTYDPAPPGILGEVWVVASQDGGDNFTFAGEVTDGVETLLWVFAMDVSMEIDGIHNIAVAGLDDNGGADNPVLGTSREGSVWRLQAGTWLSAGWEDTGDDYDGWDNGVKFVLDVEFSPNFDIDDTIVCLGMYQGVSSSDYYRTGGEAVLQSGIWEGSGGTYNEEAGFPGSTTIVADGETIYTGAYNRLMGFALPADYDGSDSGARVVFLYVNGLMWPSEVMGGFVFRADNNSLSPVVSPPGDPLLASIDVKGEADTGSLMIGELFQWDDTDDTWSPWGTAMDVFRDCYDWVDYCGGVRVWHTEELDICCVQWEEACKNPSGPYMALVMYTPDGEKSYATTSGSFDMEQDGNAPGDNAGDLIDGYMYDMGCANNHFMYDDGTPLDESAFSVSRDDGVSFNQIGLIDTDIDYLSDVAVCPDCSTIYLSTISNWWEPCAGCGEGYSDCDSVWRSYDDGDTWERIYYGALTNDPDQHLLLRVPCDAIEDCCDQDAVAPSGTIYLGVQGTMDLFYSRDCGQCWNDPPATKVYIQDFCVESENVVYIINDTGDFSKSTQYGRRWSDSDNVGIDYGHSIVCCCDEGFVVVGGAANEEVAWSDDGGDSWNLTDALPGTSSGEVHVACDPVCENIIYAATDDNSSSGIFRTDVTDGAWDEISILAMDYTSIVVAREGTLYAAFDDLYAKPWDDPDATPCDTGFYTTDVGGGYWTSGVARNLTPCETACCGKEDWDYLICGLENEEVDFDLQPNELKICGCLSADTNSILWGIDNDHYNMSTDCDDYRYGQLWSYEDCAAKMGPTLTSPADGAVLECEPCAGCDAANFTLKWERMCDACSYDIEIMDEDGNVVVSWTDEVITGDPPTLFVDGTLENDEVMEYFLECGMSYTWHVREANTSCECVHSPWSDTWTFTVTVGAADAIQLLAPEKGAMGTPIQNIGFSWTSVRNASSYSFVLSPNANLTGALVSQDMSTTAFNYVGPLDYSKAYYWQIIAWEDGTRLTTSSIGVFNTMAAPVAPTPPVVVEQQPAPVINIPPAEEITPTWIYAIIGIGAALAVVVIVLIVRTRRP